MNRSLGTTDPCAHDHEKCDSAMGFVTLDVCPLECDDPCTSIGRCVTHLHVGDEKHPMPTTVEEDSGTAVARANARYNITTDASVGVEDTNATADDLVWNFS